MLSTENPNGDYEGLLEAEAVEIEGPESAERVVKSTFAVFRADAVALEARAKKLIDASFSRGTADLPSDPMELLKKNILEAEAMLQKAADAEGLNGVLRTTDILDAAGRSWGKIQAILEQAEEIWVAHGYQSPYASTKQEEFQSPAPPIANAPRTPSNLFSPAPPKSAHLPDSPLDRGRESTGTVSTMSAPMTPAVLKERKMWDKGDDNYEESPTMETLGLSERGLAILREDGSGSPKVPSPPSPKHDSPQQTHGYYASPLSPHAAAHLHDSPEPSSPDAGQAQDAETPMSADDGPRLDGEDMEDTFANLNIHDFGSRMSMPAGSRMSMPAPQPLIELADEGEESEEDMPEPMEHTFTSRSIHLPTTPGTVNTTRSRIPVLTPGAAPPPSDSLYPLLNPVAEEEYSKEMDAFGMRSTPLEWLNEAIATVNEALTDARFDEVDNGAGWREVTVKELEIMLNLPEGKVMGFIAACLKLGRLAPATKRGGKAYRIVEFVE